MLFKPRRFIICTPEKSGLQGEQEKGENTQKQKNLSDGVRYSSESSDKLIKKNQKLNTVGFVPLIRNLAISLIFLGLGFILNLFLSIPKAQAASISTNLDVARNVVNNNISILINNEAPAENPEVTLTAEGFLSKPLVVETKVTKEAKVIRTTTTTRKIRSVTSNLTQTSGNHFFPYGYCTYYVAQKRFIPWSGNAIAWLGNARVYGYEIGDSPRVGAIVATSEGGATGHVAMVDAVEGDKMTISEMNYRGFGVISSRTISVSYSRILGYIY